MFNTSWYRWLNLRNPPLNLFYFFLISGLMCHYFLSSHFLKQELRWIFSYLVFHAIKRKPFLSKFSQLIATEMADLSSVVFDWSLWICYTLRRSIHWLNLLVVVYNFQGVTGCLFLMVKILISTERRKEVCQKTAQLWWETILLNQFQHFRVGCQLIFLWQLLQM